MSSHSTYSFYPIYLPLTLAGLMLLALTHGCGPNIPERDDNGDDINGNGNGEEIIPEWPAISQTLTQSCAQAGCHGTNSPILDLSNEEAYSSIIRIAGQQLPSLNLIEPGDPQSSYLLLKLQNLQADACLDAGAPISQCGSQMPPPPNPELDNDILHSIRRWIEEGANRDG